jgi:predicted transcriptional regulator
MKDEARFLRGELGRIGTRRGRCVPPQIKARASAWLRAQRSAGRTVAELAVELGVAAGTVLRWSNEAVRAIVPVHVVPDASGGERVAVVSPSGFRIESVTLEDAVRVLRELG